MSAPDLVRAAWRAARAADLRAYRLGALEEVYLPIRLAGPPSGPVVEPLPGLRLSAPVIEADDGHAAYVPTALVRAHIATRPELLEAIPCTERSPMLVPAWWLIHAPGAGRPEDLALVARHEAARRRYEEVRRADAPISAERRRLAERVLVEERRRPTASEVDVDKILAARQRRIRLRIRREARAYDEVLRAVEKRIAQLPPIIDRGGAAPG